MKSFAQVNVRSSALTNAAWNSDGIHPWTSTKTIRCSAAHTTENTGLLGGNATIVSADRRSDQGTGCNFRAIWAKRAGASPQQTTSDVHDAGATSSIEATPFASNSNSYNGSPDSNMSK